jgi:methionine synthase II (cobalamin-independent)
MANLRGGTFEKQIKDAFHRTLALGESRHMKEDNFTHSLALAQKREMYLRDFKEYLEQKGITEGKINTYMTEQTIRDFLEQRTEHLSHKSALDYTTGFNSLLKGLEQANITIPANPSRNDFLKDFRETFRSELKELEIESGRYIQNLDQKLEELKEIRFESYVIAKIQSETGLRVNEALEVAKNFSNYYNEQNSNLEGIIGKGNHEYAPKEISYQLAQEIQKLENIPHYNTYRNDLQKVGIDRSHDFRVTYAKDLLESKLEQGISYKEALKEVSQEINHHRPEMTEYYLAKI